MLVPAKWALNPRPRSVYISVNSAPEYSHHSGSKMLIPIPIWNRYQTLTQIPWNPFYLLVDVLVPLASAVALAKGSRLQPCPEDCPWAMEATLPKVKIPSSQVRNPREGYERLALLFQGRTDSTVQFMLQSLRGSDGNHKLPLPCPAAFTTLQMPPERTPSMYHLHMKFCLWLCFYGT